ncbi:hypothetical protein UFOVP1192_38 [uncultured Caudovirales phage]|uniref:Uncharacterized protein n=1 Tax=uncultured Caudovirales phage TaxID=2100421 RepID=A0A6J5R0G3_9CAUD|nr:hypothetical protein UFOVP1192_38 [uncultured Caudovirales phage]
MIDLSKLNEVKMPPLFLTVSANREYPYEVMYSYGTKIYFLDAFADMGDALVYIDYKMRGVKCC